MEGPDYTAVSLLGFGAGLLLIAALVSLLQRTRGVSLRRRPFAMVATVWQTTRPFHRSLTVTAAGLISFLAGGGVCLACCFAILTWYKSALPRRTEVFEAMADLPALVCGLGLSLLISFVVGLVTGARAASGVSKLWNEAPPTGEHSESLP